MDLAPYVSSLADDLTAVAAAGDEDSRRAAAALTTALEPAARMALMNALSDLAAEVTAQLDGPVVELRLDGRDVRIAVTGPGPARHGPNVGAEGPDPSPDGTPGGDISRITLRLFDQLKSQAERSAAEQGVSLNTWVAHAVQGALRHPAPSGSAVAEGVRERSGSRPRDERRHVQGWVRG